MNEMKEIIKVLAELMSDHERIKSDIGILYFEIRDIKNKMAAIKRNENENEKQ